MCHLFADYINCDSDSTTKNKSIQSKLFAQMPIRYEGLQIVQSKKSIILDFNPFSAIQKEKIETTVQYQLDLSLYYDRSFDCVHSLYK